MEGLRTQEGPGGKGEDDREGEDRGDEQGTNRRKRCEGNGEKEWGVECK